MFPESSNCWHFSVSVFLYRFVLCLKSQKEKVCGVGGGKLGSQEEALGAVKRVGNVRGCIIGLDYKIIMFVTAKLLVKSIITKTN